MAFSSSLSKHFQSDLKQKISVHVELEHWMITLRSREAAACLARGGDRNIVMLATRNAK